MTNELKEKIILSLLNVDENKVEKKQIASSMIGRVCMFRTYSAGVHYGELVERDGRECLLKNSRRIFYWVKACSLSQLAMEGSKDFDNCKIAMTVPELFLSEVIEIIPMSEVTVDLFNESPVWKK